MRKWFLFFSLFFLLACNRNKEEGLSYLNAQNANEYFKAIEKICNTDNGKLWGENLYGPVMFIDIINRNIYANAPDKNGLLKLRDSVYTGMLPKEKPVTLNNVEYGGTLYAMVPLPVKEDFYRITSWSLHSLYHCFQERHHLRDNVSNVSHMNDESSRLLLKLEWKALDKAINSDSSARYQAIRDALVFRGARRELYSAGVKEENTFECMEGLATFTYIKLCSENTDQFQSRLIEYLHKISKSPSYSVSYGFVHGALYAFLLDLKDYDFSTITCADFDLAAETARLYNIRLPDYCRDVAGSLAMGYDLANLRTEEAELQKMIRDKTHKITSSFTEKPTLKINLESPNFSFEPEDIFPLDTIGNLYRKLRVSDNWGRLTADDGGVLISYDLKTLWISTDDVNTERNHLSGKGWQIILNDGWRLTKDGDNYSVFKPVP